jgi:hypothetical protein
MSPGAPCKCPNCESEKITYTERFEDCTIEVCCQDCSCRWIELYRFIGIEVWDAGCVLHKAKPCSACGTLTEDAELSQGHKMCPECFRNYEQ